MDALVQTEEWGGGGGGGRGSEHRCSTQTRVQALTCTKPTLRLYNYDHYAPFPLQVFLLLFKLGLRICLLVVERKSLFKDARLHHARLQTRCRYKNYHHRVMIVIVNVGVGMRGTVRVIPTYSLPAMANCTDESLILNNRVRGARGFEGQPIERAFEQ